jgi:hypothetical protein
MSAERNHGAELKAYIDAEIRKMQTLPPSELQTLLAPWLDPIRQAVEGVQALQLGLTTWIEGNREWLVQIGQIVQEASARAGTFMVTWSEASERFAETLKEVERLADIGWTLPTQLSVPELIEFLGSPDDDTAAAYLIRKFAETDPEFLRMEVRLCQDRQLREFQTILPQCFRAIRQYDYAIAVPALVAILERVIQKLNPEHLHANTDVVKTLREKGEIAQRAQEDLFCAAVWLSLFKAVGSLWMSFPLNVPNTPTLSRPGIQHGRIEPPNTKCEIIRLLNTLETALALHELLDETNSFSIRSRSEKGAVQPLFALLHANFYLPRDKHHQDDASTEKTDRA